MAFFANILFMVSLIVPPLTQADESREWSTHPSGIVIVNMGKVWGVYSATQVACKEGFVPDGKRVLFSHGGVCHQINVAPIGYYTSDPSKSYDLKLIPTLERTEQ